MDSNRSFENRSILVTCGPTWVPIDDTRVISNISSGRLGQLISRSLADQGARVTLLEGPVRDRLDDDRVRVIPHTYFDELQENLKHALETPLDTVIHAAAVSDYKARKKAVSKIRSDQSRLSIELVPTGKLIRLVKKLQPKTRLIGFKLHGSITRETAIQTVSYLFRDSDCDWVVANSILPRDNYQAYLVSSDETIVGEADSREALSELLVETLKSHQS